MIELTSDLGDPIWINPALILWMNWDPNVGFTMIYVNTIRQTPHLPEFFRVVEPPDVIAHMIKVQTLDVLEARARAEARQRRERHA